MRRMLLPLALLLLTALPAHAQSPPNARVAQVDTSAYPVVKLYVSVIDASGKPTPGLTARDFAITEDGQPITIDEFVGGGAGSIDTVLVIDRSGSMSGDKIEAAKESARATAEVLEAADLITVIAFDNQPMTVVRLQRASNRLRISTDIARLMPGGGTNILPALQEAYNVLAPASATASSRFSVSRRTWAVATRYHTIALATTRTVTSRMNVKMSLVRILFRRWFISSI